MKMGVDQVIRNKVELIEPERRYLAKNFAFVRYRVGQDAVEGGNAVSCNNQEVFAEIKDFTHFAAAEFRNSRKITGEKIHGAARIYAG